MGKCNNFPPNRDMILHRSSTMLYAPVPSATANIRSDLDAAKIAGGRKREQSGETLVNTIRPSPSKALRLTDTQATPITNQLAGTPLVERTSLETRFHADAESALTKIATTSGSLIPRAVPSRLRLIGSTATESVAIETEPTTARIISTGGTVKRAEQLEQEAKIKTKAAREMYAARKAQVDALRAQADEIELQADEQFSVDIQETVALRKRALELRETI